MSEPLHEPVDFDAGIYSMFVDGLHVYQYFSRLLRNFACKFFRPLKAFLVDFQILMFFFENLTNFWKSRLIADIFLSNT